MTFKPDKVWEFQHLFERNKQAIRSFDGVKKLALYRDKNQDNIFFTYSVWDSEENLEKYRHSELFNSVWTNVRALFESKAETWSLDQLISM